MVNLHNLQDLLQQEVSRKEFLQCLGIALLSMVGITNVLNSLQKGLNSPTSAKQAPHGYGASPYGK